MNGPGSFLVEPIAERNKLADETMDGVVGGKHIQPQEDAKRPAVSSTLFIVRKLQGGDLHNHMSRFASFGDGEVLAFGMARERNPLFSINHFKDGDHPLSFLMTQKERLLTVARLCIHVKQQFDRMGA